MKYGVQIAKEGPEKWGVTFLVQRTNLGPYTVRRRLNGRAMVTWIDHSNPEASAELLRIVSRALKGRTP